MRPSLPLALSVCTVLSLCTALPMDLRLAAAEEWTRFRGPNGSGWSDTAGIPTKFSSDEYNWRVEIPGMGHSQAVVWGDRLFLTSSLRSGRERLVLCLDPKDGSTRWTRSIASATHRLHKQNSFASGTPAVSEEAVFIAFSSAEDFVVQALDHSGKMLWERNLGPFVSLHGHGGSPVVHGGLVVLANEQSDRGGRPSESFLVALDRTDGSIRWRIPRQSSRVTYSTPCVIRDEAGKERLVFNSFGHGMSLVDPADGKVLWSNDCFKLRTVSSPVYSENLLFGTCGSGGGGNYLVAVKAKDGEEAYRIKKAASYVPTPLVRGDRLYMISDETGIASAYVASTGEKLWQERLEGRPSFSGSPVGVENRIYAIARSGDVYVIAADDSFDLLAINPLGEPSRSTPTVADGQLYLRTQGPENGHLISIGAASP